MAAGRLMKSRAPFPRAHLIALALTGIAAVGGYLLLPATPLDSDPELAQSRVPEPSAAPLSSAQPTASLLPLPVEPTVADLVEEPQPRDMAHEVQPGETLGGIFRAQGFEHASMNAVLAADEELLALDVLRPGQRLHFEVDGPSGQLQQLALVMHPGRTIHYRRLADGSFEFEEVLIAGQWREQVLSTSIHGSFYASANRAGVSDADIIQAQRILEERMNFRRDIQAGDRFELVLGREMFDSGAVGQSRIEAIRLQLGRRTLSAFLHADGNYYDAQGESLGRAFLRYPMQGNYRVSSPYNLRRLHPVTGRIAPHHGVDFAMPTGTPILSIGDGVVSRVGNHPFAGRYLEISHPGQFKTRYLHLSQIQVRQGQAIGRGQRIALSGNTGRSTGPHLHFELHINGRPVDPLKADIPTAASVPEADRLAFNQRVRMLAGKMQQQRLLALGTEPNARQTDI